MATIHAERGRHEDAIGRSAIRPRLRHDVDVLVGEQGARVLRDLRTGREFKLGRWESRVVRLLDGSRRSREVCRDLASLHGVRCDPRVIDRFVGELHRAGLLAERHETDARPFIFERRGFLYMVRLPRSDAWLRRIAEHFQWLRHPGAAIAGSVMVATGLVVAALNSNDIVARIADAWRSGHVLAALGLCLAAVLVHEIAHAVAAVSFGARVMSAGVGVYYFRPCLFCEIRGVELLARSQRLVISSAGLASDLVLASIAVTIWRFLPPGPAASTALLVASLLFVRVVLNLNPLVKLDGYYLLVDYVGRRDLRESAFRALGAWAGAPLSTFLKRPSSHAVKPGPGELVYGILAIGYVGALFVAGALTIERWLRATIPHGEIIVALLVFFGLATLTDRAMSSGPRRRQTSASLAGSLDRPQSRS